MTKTEGLRFGFDRGLKKVEVKMEKLNIKLDTGLIVLVTEDRRVSNSNTVNNMIVEKHKIEFMQDFHE